MRRFHSWTPGAVWTPPPRFYQINYKRELLRACGRLAKSLPQLEINKNLEAFVREWANTSSSSAQVRQDRLLLPQIFKPKLAVYSPLLLAVYEKQSYPAIRDAYKKMPSPRPKFIDGHVLDAMLARLQQLSRGGLYARVVDDMIRAQYPVTTSERAYYILNVARRYLHDTDRGRQMVTAKMLSWTQYLDTRDKRPLNMLLEAGLLLDLVQLQDFALTRLSGGDSHTARLLLEFNKMDALEVLQSHFVPPKLLKVVVRRMLPSNATAAHDILAYVLARKHTRAKPMSAEEELFCLKALTFIEWGSSQAPGVLPQPFTLPQVPTVDLFEEFLDFYTSAKDFSQLRRLLVQMASHGCFPTESSIVKLLDAVTSSDQLDVLVHYLCDVSLYHKILTVDLARKLCTVYRQFDEQVANELQTFLVSIVRQQPELIDVEKLNFA